MFKILLPSVVNAPGAGRLLLIRSFTADSYYISVAFDLSACLDHIGTLQSSGTAWFVFGTGRQLYADLIESIRFLKSLLNVSRCLKVQACVMNPVTSKQTNLGCQQSMPEQVQWPIYSLPIIVSSKCVLQAPKLPVSPNAPFSTKSSYYRTISTIPKLLPFHLENRKRYQLLRLPTFSGSKSS